MQKCRLLPHLVPVVNAPVFAVPQNYSVEGAALAITDSGFLWNERLEFGEAHTIKGFGPSITPNGFGPSIIPNG